MRRLVALLVVLAACGCGGVARDGTQTSVSEPSLTTIASLSPPPTSTTRASSPTVAAPTTATASATTSPATTVVPVLPAILRFDGVAAVDFGTEADEAMAAFVDLLGSPTEVVEEGQHDCYLSMDRVRFVTWADIGLRVVFTDWGGTDEAPVASPLHLTDWEIVGPGVAMVDGLGWGTTVGELRAKYPGVRIGINEFAPMFIVDEPSGGIIGGFDWSYEEFAAAVVEALNERGAGLAPDDLDAATGQALLDFMEAEGLDDAVDVLTALGLPRDAIAIGFVHAGAGPLCD